MAKGWAEYVLCFSSGFCVAQLVEVRKTKGTLRAQCKNFKLDRKKERRRKMGEGKQVEENTRVLEWKTIRSNKNWIGSGGGGLEGEIGQKLFERGLLLDVVLHPEWGRYSDFALKRAVFSERRFHEMLSFHRFHNPQTFFRFWKIIKITEFKNVFFNELEFSLYVWILWKSDFLGRFLLKGFFCKNQGFC